MTYGQFFFLQQILRYVFVKDKDEAQHSWFTYFQVLFCLECCLIFSVHVYNKHFLRACLLWYRHVRVMVSAFSCSQVYALVLPKCDRFCDVCVRVFSVCVCLPR